MYRLIVFLLFLPTPLPAQTWSPDATDYPSRWGMVTFDHQRHDHRAESCRVCHHQGVKMGPCGSCHGVIPGLPLRKDVLHKKCVACHWQKNGPTECSGCHDPNRLDESVYAD